MRSGSANLHTISRQFSYNFAKSWLFVEFLQRSLRCGILIKSAVHQCLKKWSTIKKAILIFDIFHQKCAFLSSDALLQKRTE